MAEKISLGNSIVKKIKTQVLFIVELGPKCKKI